MKSCAHFLNTPYCATMLVDSPVMGNFAVSSRVRDGEALAESERFPAVVIS